VHEKSDNEGITNEEIWDAVEARRKSGDKTYTDDLAKKLKELVSICFFKVWIKQDIPDLIQDTLERFFKKLLNDPEDIEDPIKFLRGIANNVFLTYIKKKQQNIKHTLHLSDIEIDSKARNKHNPARNLDELFAGPHGKEALEIYHKIVIEEASKLSLLNSQVICAKQIDRLTLKEIGKIFFSERIDPEDAAKKIYYPIFKKIKLIIMERFDSEMIRRGWKI